MHAMADEARAIALKYFRAPLDIEAKSGAEFDPVTIADREIEAALRRILRHERPDDAIIGEEDSAQPGISGRSWIIDPIDGTRAFVAGLPSWCVLIALCTEDDAKLGLIDQPFTQERFLGHVGEQCVWMQREQTRLLSTNAGVETLETALIATTDPGLFSGAESEAFSQLASKARIRRYGLDAYAYGALALGGIDLVVESGLKTWDVAALIPVVKAAGGEISNWSGGSCLQGGQVVAAANPTLHAKALAVLSAAAER